MHNFSKLLDEIEKRFHDGVGKRVAEALGLSSQAYSHLRIGRRKGTFRVLELIRTKYGSKSNKSRSLTDAEILDMILHN
jgi:transcriptional regulator with XRE-family HTH domain